MVTELEARNRARLTLHHVSEARKDRAGYTYRRIILVTLLAEDHAVALASVGGRRSTATHLSGLGNGRGRALRRCCSLVRVQLVDAKTSIALVSKSRVARRRRTALSAHVAELDVGLVLRGGSCTSVGIEVRA